MFTYLWRPQHTYTETIQVTPALTATLPGQLNPFYFSIMTYKSSVISYSIDGITSSPWESGDVYYSLTIASFTHEGTIFTGIVRNDSAHTLHHLRVVAFEPKGMCAWLEALVDSNSLLPAQETTFHLASACLSDNLIIVSQGADSP